MAYPDRFKGKVAVVTGGTTGIGRAIARQIVRDGGKVVINQEVNRVQIIFDGKPDPDVRSELKGEGFRWAPSQGAWQRQLTDNALRAVKRLKCVAPSA